MLTEPNETRNRTINMYLMTISIIEKIQLFRVFPEKSRIHIDENQGSNRILEIQLGQ